MSPEKNKLEDDSITTFDMETYTSDVTNIVVNPNEKSKLVNLDKDLKSGIGIVLSGLHVLSENTKHSEVIARSIYETALNGAVTTVKALAYIDMQNNHPSEIEVESNPARRPILEIIKDGLDRFKTEHSEILLHYDINQQESLSGILQDFTQPIKGSKEYIRTWTNRELSEEELNYLATQPIGEVFNVFYKDKTLKLQGIGSYIKHMFTIEGKSSARSAEQHVGNDNFEISALDSQATNIMKKFKEINIINGVPTSSSELFFLCLESRNGNINEALLLATILLKYNSRADTEWESYEKPVVNEPMQAQLTAFMKDTILDEFSEYNIYNLLDRDKPKYKGLLGDYYRKLLGNSINTESSHYSYDPWIYHDFALDGRVGLPYHAFHMVTLLEKFSPETITFMMCGEYAQYGDQHGLVKFLSDLRTCSELYKIKDYLKQYS